MRVACLLCIGAFGVLGSGCLSPVMTFGGGKTAKQAQRDTLGEMMPAQLDVDGTWQGQPGTATIRVWADDSYRAQNVHWQKTFDESLAYANAVVGPMFGVRLRADYRAWNRHAAGEALDADLAALVAQDAGTDVFAVVGLTSSLSLVSATFDQLGLAEVGGKHLVMRGYADLEERKLFVAAFPDLGADERETVLDARRGHKNTTVLLHELGHTLGYEHDGSGETIMAAQYSHHAATFSAAARGAILAAVDQRLGRGGAASPAVATGGAAGTTGALGAGTPAAGGAPPGGSGAGTPTGGAGASGATPASAAAAKPAGPSLTVFVTDMADVVIDGTYHSRTSIDAKFADVAKRDLKTEIVIKRSRHAPADILVEIMDLAKKHGLENFTLATN